MKKVRDEEKIRWMGGTYYKQQRLILPDKAFENNIITQFILTLFAATAILLFAFLRCTF